MSHEDNYQTKVVIKSFSLYQSRVKFNRIISVVLSLLCYHVIILVPLLISIGRWHSKITVKASGAGGFSSTTTVDLLSFGDSIPL